MNIIDYSLMFLIIIGSFYLVWRVRSKITFEDFIIAKRSVSAKHFLSTYVATNVSVAGMLVGMTAAAYLYGFQVLWALVGWIAGTLLFFAVAERKKDFFAKYHTLQEFLKQAYNSHSCQIVAAIIMIILFWGSISVGLLAIMRIFDLFIPFSLAIAIFALLLAILYTAIGGYRGVLITDVFQILMISIVFVIIPVLIFNYGGISSLSAAFGSQPVLQEPWWLIALAFLVLFVPFQLVAPDMWTRTAASKNIKEAKKGMLWSLVLFFLLFSVVIAIGFWARHIDPTLLPDLAFASVIKRVVPVGLLGLTLGGIVMVAISTVDTSLMTIIQMIFYDIKGGKMGKKSLSKLRIGVLIVGLSAILLPLLSPSIVDVLFAIFAAQLALLPAVLGGLFLKKERRHSAGAIASMIIGFIAGLLVVVFLKQAPVAPIATLIVSSLVYLPFVFFKKRIEEIP